MAARETVGDRVRRYRRLRKLTQEALAAAASVDRSYLGKIEVGDVVEPGADTIRRLAAALEVPLRSLAEPLGWYDEDDEHPADAFVVGGRNMSALTDADREVVLQVAERLREIAEHASKS